MTTPRTAASASLLGCVGVTAVALSWVGAQVAPATASTSPTSTLITSVPTTLTPEQQRLAATIAKEKAALAALAGNSPPTTVRATLPSSSSPTPTTVPRATTTPVQPGPGTTTPPTVPTTTPTTAWVPPVTVVTSGASGAIR